LSHGLALPRDARVGLKLTYAPLRSSQLANGWYRSERAQPMVQTGTRSSLPYSLVFLVTQCVAALGCPACSSTVPAAAPDGSGASTAPDAGPGQDAHTGGPAADSGLVDAGGDAPLRSPDIEAGLDAFPTGGDGSTTTMEGGGTTNSGIRFIGRVDASKPQAVRFAWSGSGLVATVSGAKISVQLQTEAATSAFF
jgi:hypothetical protein